MEKINIVKEWLNFANKDINSAKYLLGMHPVPLEIICYHCEQAAEKALKAYLINRDIEPSRTHDLRLLCKMCADFDESFNEISKQCINLTAFGVQPRYPFELQITDGDVETAIADADSILEFILQRL
mgnify:FL=1